MSQSPASSKWSSASYLRLYGNPLERKSYCVLVLDEMQIMPEIEYDPTLPCFIGSIDESFYKKAWETTEAKHAFAFMAKDLFENWK